MSNLTQLRLAVEKAQKAVDDYEIDSDSRDVIDSYNSMLDECYSFSSVGGPFKYLQASSVLKEMCETDYRVGMSDYVDSLDKEDFGDYKELVEALEEAETELEDYKEAISTHPVSEESES